MARRGRIEHRPQLTDPAAGPAAPPPAAAPAPDSAAAAPAVNPNPPAVPSPSPGEPQAALPVSQPAPASTPASKAPAVADSYTLLEVAQHLNVSPETLRAWRRRFGRFLSIGPAAPAEGAQPDAEDEWPTFTQGDVAVLLTIQSLLDQGYTDAQVSESLQPRRIEPARLSPAGALAPARAGSDLEGSGGQGGALMVGQAGQMLGDMLGALAGSQQAVLNSQASMREMVSVVVQDNFNLKDENRKLRERMLELERALAEYQRREETRKERMEARMRAMEGTMAALQQQMAQFVQIQRAQQRKRGLW